METFINVKKNFLLRITAQNLKFKILKIYEKFPSQKGTQKVTSLKARERVTSMAIKYHRRKTNEKKQKRFEILKFNEGLSRESPEYINE